MGRRSPFAPRGAREKGGTPLPRVSLRFTRGYIPRPLWGRRPKPLGQAQRVAIQRQIESTDREIDRLVYDLYGLTEEEIAIVEGGPAWQTF